MKKKIIVLGAGLVGATIARDLSDRFDVSSADVNEVALERVSAFGVSTVKLDFNNPEELKKGIADFDLVIGAVPGFLGFETLKTVLEAGKNAVDISFFPEDPFLLDSLAKKMSVTAVVDCGVAPGMGNIILGFHNKRMNVQRYECLVGGLPSNPEWPYMYKAVFSPIDVIEEYTRPARFVAEGKLVVKEALTDPELVQFDTIGALESWNSDGLRTLLRTMPHIPYMIEKTLRFPGSITPIRILRDSGFFSEEPVLINNQQIRPIDMTAKLLFPKWKLANAEEEFTIMRITISGIEDNNQQTIQYDLLDRSDISTGTRSMARTTGYTCTAVASWLLDGGSLKKGINPPEYLGEEESTYRFISAYLEQRGVSYTSKKFSS